MSTDARPNAPRIPRSTWEKHRYRIKALFVDQKKTLSQVIKIMKQYGLHASESQYERQLKIWGIRKNRTREEWCLIKRVVEERRLQGRDSTVLIDGVVQPSERLEREFARSDYRTHGDFESHLPGHIEVMSPPAAAPSLNISVGNSDSEDGVSRPTQADSWRSRFDIWTLGCVLSTAATWCVLGRGSDMLEQARHGLSRMARRLGLRFTLASILQDWESSLGWSNPLDCYESPSEDPDIVMSDYEPDFGGSPVITPPSPSGAWSVASLESVGITSEEWVTRGWNVFFGAWG